MKISDMIELLRERDGEQSFRVVVDGTDRDGLLLSSVLSSTIGADAVICIGKKEGAV